jgi:hypothetical protein
MKLVILIEDCMTEFEKMVDAVKNKESLLLDTENCDEIHEYYYLLDGINYFSQTSKEIMLAKFSGRNTVVEGLGDERPEMIIPLSCRTGSRYYTENPVKMFLDLIDVFEKGDRNGITIKKSAAQQGIS